MTDTSPPTKVISWDDFYNATDDGNKLMDRVWYCIACSDAGVGKQTVFWEHWYWKEGEAGKELKSKSPKVCSNHTFTISPDKEVDYPIWPVKFTKTSFKMYPAIDFKCFVIAPFGMSMKPVAFPSNDSKSEFRVDYTRIAGKDMYFIFALDPHISASDQNKEFEKLEKEAGIKKDWFHMVKWDPNYKIGSTGEPDINR
mmetsp:Transcript_17098/g.35118  ORF Transcript_17098/g.35118 Transcript_17098/m.35118 type:complete len:198 (+) Transcript_17098:131-724(+)|eukprot:CAMPEP_0201121680 /NCGR_PEP_ID=MMETSP0850-20130426/5511_1 /ASSEMBLY_ACC=CAM_ASM_000622 /TAXON_ID=183588 /ORGANISM="Pseudo-nitzschia fraudulenta, Strain WWA7" /LENGTH=197 /DNA_ID=CAMNT_0047388211 /DNA_START=146 /DNA_END=739 /DNA_ORIENTATION=+